LADGYAERQAAGVPDNAARYFIEHLTVFEPDLDISR
jgi:hypothetical protein